MSAPVVTDAQVKVQETADDAAMSKLSAVRMGYVNDPFISIFVPKFQRRSPLINRGYFARMSAVDLVIKRFVSVCNHNGGTSNVVSLGAGVDTAFFRACMNKYAPTHYYEVDFHDITTKKVELIKQHEVLQKYIAAEPVDLSELPTIERVNPYPASSPAKSQQDERTQAKAAAGAKENKYHGIQFLPVDAGGSDAKGMDLHGKRYSLVTADLRDIAALQAALHSAGFNPAVPTLFLSECVLVYLEPEDSCSIIAWAAKSCPKSVFVTYEQIRPHDAFGQIMARNLEERGYALRGLHAFPDIPAQVARYVELGYAACTVIDMNDVYYRLLPRAEVARVERLELFDELEEWHLMSAHYALALAVNDVDLGGEGGGRLADVLQAAATGHGPIRSTGSGVFLPVGSPLPAGASSSSLRTPAGGSKQDTYDSELASASGRSTPASSTVGTPASKMARTGSTPTQMTNGSAPFGTAQAEAGAQHAATGIEMSSPRDLANAVVHTHEEVERMHGHGHGAHGGSSMTRGSLGGSARSGLGLSITAAGGSVSAAPPSPTHSVASMSSTHSALPAYTSAYGGSLGVSMSLSLSSSLSGRPSLGGGGTGIGSAARGRAFVGGAAAGSSSMPPTAPGSLSRGGERRERSRSGSAAMDSESETGALGPGAYASRDHGLVASATRAGLAGQSPRPMSVSGMSVGGADSIVRGSSTPMSMSTRGTGGGTVGAGGALDNTTHGAGHAPVPLGAGGTLFHTQAGDIVLGTAGPVDFDAIAAADDEMSHARHMREALGLDLLRDTGEDIEDTASVVSSMSTSHGVAGGSGAGAGPGMDSSAHGTVEALPRSRGESLAGQGQGSGGIMAPPPPPGVGVSGKSSSTSTGTGKRSKDAATAKSAAAAGAQHAHSKAEVAALLMAPVKEDTPSGHGRGGGSTTGSLSASSAGTHHLYKPAVDNSRQHSLHAVTGMTHRPPYDAAAIDASAASGRRVSLFDMLFPVDAWSTPASGTARQALSATAVQRA